MNDRFVCTQDDPWNKEKGKFACHPDAVRVGDQEDGYPHGDTQKYRCPHCGLEFIVELSQ